MGHPPDDNDESQYTPPPPDYHQQPQPGQDQPAKMPSGLSYKERVK